MSTRTRRHRTGIIECRRVVQFKERRQAGQGVLAGRVLLDPVTDLRIELHESTDSVCPLSDRAIGNLRLIGQSHEVEPLSIPDVSRSNRLAHVWPRLPMAAFQTPHRGV